MSLTLKHQDVIWDYLTRQQCIDLSDHHKLALERYCRRYFVVSPARTLARGLITLNLRYTLTRIDWNFILNLYHQT